MLRKKQVLIVVSIAVVSFLIGTSMASDGGNPWDRVWEAIHDLESDVDTLNASYLDLLERVETLENQMLPEGVIGTPAYDSGWLNIDRGQIMVLTHNLDTLEVWVYLVGKSPEGVNQKHYGGYYGEGCWWDSLTSTSITVVRNTDDNTCPQVRIQIWRIEEPPA